MADIAVCLLLQQFGIDSVETLLHLLPAVQKAHCFGKPVQTDKFYSLSEGSWNFCRLQFKIFRAYFRMDEINKVVVKYEYEMAGIA